jgi:hypothetical protein
LPHLPVIHISVHGLVAPFFAVTVACYMSSSSVTVLSEIVNKSKSKTLYDRQSVGRSVLVSGTHLGPATNVSFSLRFFFRQLRVWYFVAPSLTRERVCNLLLLLVLTSAVPLWSALSDETSGLSFVSISL